MAAAVTAPRYSRRAHELLTWVGDGACFAHETPTMSRSEAYHLREALNEHEPRLFERRDIWQGGPSRRLSPAGWALLADWDLAHGAVDTSSWPGPRRPRVEPVAVEQPALWEAG